MHSNSAVFVLLLLLCALSAPLVAQPKEHVQNGYATFVTRGLDAEKTASGERFDPRQLVGAHRTLPFGSMVRVTNLENGRTVDVRIIDRGPSGQNVREGTIIDLSKAAADRIGMVPSGQVRVRLVILRLGGGPIRSSSNLRSRWPAFT